MTMQPIWPDVPDQPEFHGLLPGPVDVCVIGAGIAGLSVAYRLTQQSKKVLVVDAGGVGSGMTAVTTAHLASVLDDRFSRLEEQRGVEATRTARDAHAAAVDFIEETARKENIDCGFARVDGYLFAATPDDDETLAEEAGAAERAGQPVERLNTFPLPGFRAGRTLKFPRQARFNPTLYLAGLARAIVRDGGRVITNARVESVEDGEPCKVTLPAGRIVHAKAVVVATNSPFNDRVTMHTKQYPYITYVVGLRVPNPGALDGLVWDTVDPYHYVRPAGPGAGDDVVIVGGEDHKTGQADDGEERLRRLEAWGRERIPGAGEVTHRWSGQVLETPDGLAYIGRNPGETNVYIVTGDSGMGMTHGTIAGLILPDLIATGSHPWADLFDPARKPPVHGLGEFASENANVALQYTSWLTGGDVKSTDDIKPGSGAVMRSGLSKVAVYREKAGGLVTCSAKCPHLGAVVSWNDTEKTWDCPAHGSRFNPKGEVIQGPANTDLERVTEGAAK